ncbi:hypothetical protein DICVIV_02276 [Dictyocaulus viviparus]|uniref:Uncharacterized protein n=1 Tax=Dictyocaulus viviparus TaxID=29172 RepID=A0A0D8Y6B5_DICVI|nr:hypothetical protein DICVIV_02276 [Dictyocaulus viviparus]
MVLRPSSSQWSVSPETIMSHHYKLARGVKSVVDTSPPFSMYNSPISVHYIPKRASSADTNKRRQTKLPPPHRELSEFIGSAYGKAPPSLRLPLSFNGVDVKSKLLQSRHYQPPLYRNRQKHKSPPLPPKRNTWTEEKRKRTVQNPRNKFWFDLFKDSVYTSIIDRGVFTDGVIIEVVESEMEKWCGKISWNYLEHLKEEIFEELGMQTDSTFTPGDSTTEKEKPKSKQKSPTSTGSRSDTPTSSGSSLSEVKSNSGSKSESEMSAKSETEEDESDVTSQFSDLNSESSSK